MVGWDGQARVSRGAWGCVLSLKPLRLSGVVSFLCVVLPRRGLCAKHRLFLSGWCEGHGPLGGFHIMGYLGFLPFGTGISSNFEFGHLSGPRAPGAFGPLLPIKEFKK